MLSSGGDEHDSAGTERARLLGERDLWIALEDHTHPINEVIVILEGDPEITLGDETRTLGPGGVVFIPAGTPHRTRNATTSPVRVHAMFPSERIGIEYLERNPAPGTEDDPPRPAVTIDVRALST